MDNIEKKFYDQIEDFFRLKPELRSKDNAFCWWFINYHIGDESKASDALTGRGGDKNIDAMWIDDKRCFVNILQAKFRKEFGKAKEKRNDLSALLELVDIFYDDERRKTLAKKLPSQIMQKIDEGVTRVKRNYRIRLWYVTTGKISNHYKDEFSEKAETYRGSPELRMCDYKNIEASFLEWKDNIVPHVPEYTLPIDSSFGSGGLINRTETKPKIDTWICTVKATELKKMYEFVGPQIFQRNVRGYLGDEYGINKELLKTLKNDPKSFWYFNNGITIICKDCEKREKSQNPVLVITTPQVVNGQQTTRVLSKDAYPLASVLVKVINIGDSTTNTEFIHKIVQATNTQNPVSYEDLASNNEEQIALWRAFSNANCHYIRKKGETYTEIEKRHGFRADITFSKSHLAKAVAACTIDPQIPRKGKKIFDPGESYYKRIFDSKDTDFYLSCMSLNKLLEYHLKGTIRKKHKSLYSSQSSWLIHYLIWHHLERTIKTGEGAKRFKQLYITRFQKPVPASKTFTKVIILSYKMTRNFYRDCNRMLSISKDGIAIEESQFFNKPNMWKNFMNYSKKSRRSDLKEFKKLSSKLMSELKKVQLS